MEELLYESVNSPGLREHLHEALGFCDEGRALAEELHDGRGLSILLASLAHDVAIRLSGPEPRLAPERHCPLAASNGEAESRYLRSQLCATDKTEIERLQPELKLYVDKYSYSSSSQLGGDANAWLLALRKLRRSECG